MHGNHVSIINIFVQTITIFYRFFEYGDWKMVATRSKKSQQGFGINNLP